jgi:hypothetical protein
VSTANNSAFEWIVKKGQQYPIVNETSDDRVESKILKVYGVERIVEDFFLRGDAFQHSVSNYLVSRFNSRVHEE